MMWWDTHCHFSDPRLENISSLLEQSLIEGVERIVVPSTHLDDAKQAAKLSETFNLLFAAGIHPHEATLLSNEHRSEFEELLCNGRCVAVGEIGLDYHYTLQDKVLQQQVFQSMMELAEKKSLPVVLHTRAAEEDVYATISRFPSVGGVCHSFTGEVSVLGKFLDKGFYVSFNGMITFPRSENIRELVKYAPMDRILLETDAPYLAPTPHRGKTNTPAWIPIIGQVIAEIKALPLRVVAQQTSDNATRLFGRST